MSENQKPVSYTHLDVYKRQIYAAKRMLRLRLTFANRTYYTMAPRSGHNKTASIAVLHGSMFSKPVSYTHLDVYKRQEAANTELQRTLDSGDEAA